MEYLCYTDGSCKAGEGGPGGWGFCVKTPDGRWLEGWGKARGTNAKVMEYRAVAEALAVLPDRAEATVFSDNQSLVENLSKRLVHWSASGFAKVDAEIVESVKQIAAAVSAKSLMLKLQWLRSHNGNEGNERADQLAAKGAREVKAELEAEAEARRRAGRSR